MVDINKLLIEVREYYLDNLPAHLSYHNWAHTLSVYKNVKHIGEKESLTNKEIKRLSIAALFHDIAYLESNINHEERSCEIAADWLSQYKITSPELYLIKGMIMATKLPQKPSNLPEKVIADADLMYIGTVNYKKLSEKLYIEFQYYNSNLDYKKWQNIQIDFLSTHVFHTAFCKRYYQWRKLKTLNSIVKG